MPTVSSAVLTKTERFNKTRAYGPNGAGRWPVSPALLPLAALQAREATRGRLASCPTEQRAIEAGQ